MRQRIKTVWGRYVVLRRRCVHTSVKFNSKVSHVNSPVCVGFFLGDMISTGL